MNERQLREALRDAPVEDAGARARALRVVQAAYAEQEARRPPRRRGLRPLLVACVCVLAAGTATAAATAPGDTVARWVRDVLGTEDPRPVLVKVPGGGRLLAGAWVVEADGSRRRLGGYAGATWSPNGLFVAVWRGRELSAVEPGGQVRWTVPGTHRVRVARWGPVDGFRIAYLAGGALRIVHGDGTGDRRYGSARMRVAPAWRPDDDHVLAYVDARDRVRVVAVDSGRELWRTGRVPGVRELAWAPDGRRLLVATARRLRMHARGGRLLGSHPVRRPISDVAWAPGSRRIAIVLRGAVVLADRSGRPRARPLFTGPGRFGPVAWSPTGRRLLVPWPEADQWLFLAPGRGATTAVANIARQFGPRAGRPDFPATVEWCCAK